MADDLSINDRMLFVILPNFLEPSSRVSFESAKTAGTVNDWPSAFKFFLKRYAMDGNIKQALDEIQTLT